jgi:hypothetical protein
MITSRILRAILVVALLVFVSMMGPGLVELTGVLPRTILASLLCAALLLVADAFVGRRTCVFRRVLALYVALTFLSYVAIMVTSVPVKFIGEGLGDTSLVSAIVGCLFFGIPALRFAVSRRTRRDGK